MNSKMKRVTAGVLAFVLILLAVLNHGGLETLASDNLFEDTFQTSISKDWQNQSVGTISEGKYILNKDSSNYVNNVKENTNYIVSADVTLVKNRVAEEAGFVSIAARADSTMKSGYEFGIGMSKTGSTYVRLYRTGSDGQDEILRQSSKNITSIGRIKKDQSYTLKLAVYGDRVLCLINDEIYYETTDTTYSSGYAGIKASGIKGTFDNFRIQEMPAQSIEQLTLVEHSTSVAPMEKIYFEIDVLYNSVYGTERINQDTPGVEVAGYNNTPGNKTITVSYMGQKIAFPLTVTSSYKATTLWSDAFSSAALSEEYEGGTFKNNNYNFSYDFAVKNGKAYVAFPNLNGGNVAATVNLYFLDKKAADWESYSVSTDAVIYSDSTALTKRYGQTGLIWGKAGADFLTYRCCSDGNLYIQQGTTKLRTISLSSIKAEVVKGKQYSLRVDVHESYADFYFNNKKVYTHLLGDFKMVANAGLTAVNGEVSFDNFKVTSLMARSKFATSKIEVVKSSGEKVTHVQAKNLFTSDVYLKLVYADKFSMLIPLQENMVSGYDASLTSQKAQNITVKYGNKTTSFKYTYSPYLFSDTFGGTSLGSKWTVDTTGPVSFGISNGMYQMKYDNASGINGTNTSRVSGGASWTDYTVSADVFYDDAYSVKSRVAGLRARLNGSSYYEFRIQLQRTTWTGWLYRYNDGKQTLLGYFGAGVLASCLEDQKLMDTGVIYNLKLSVRGNVIQAYINDSLLYTYDDTDENVLTLGTAGIYTANNNVRYDNFIVEEKEPQVISTIQIADSADNTFKLYEGADINVWEQKIEVKYTDGSSDKVPMTNEMLSDFDNTALGRQKITLTYKGVSSPAYVEISERPEYLKEFETMLKEFKKEIAKEDAESFYELKEVYDSLSNYELEQINDKMLEKYMDLYQQLDKSLYPEIQEETLLYDGYLDEEEAESWDEGKEGNVGKWFVKNDMFHYSQRPYDMWGTGWRVPELYGEITMISADMKMMSNQMYAGVALSIDKGYYQIRINGKAKDENGNAIKSLQIGMYQDGGQSYVAECNPALYDVEIKENEWFNICLIAKEGKIFAYLNNVLLLTYDDSLGNCYTVGQCGIRISEGDALIDNVRIYGTEMEVEEKVYEVEPTYYKDDFEDETANTNPSHWVETSAYDTVLDQWKVYTKNGSKVYGTTYKEAYTATWLHVFEDNPDVTMRFMVSDKASDGTFGFISRLAPQTAFVKIGYDASTSKWYICSQKSESDGANYFYSQDTFSVKKGEWYTAHIVEKENKVSFYINDKLIVETEEVTQTSSGRLGVFTDGASVFIDDVDCTFSGGDVPQDGVVSFDIMPDKGYNYMEIESLDDNTLVGVTGGNKFLSTDAGLTWNSISSDATWGGLMHRGFYKSLLELHDGTYLQLIVNLSTSSPTESEAFTVQSSKDLKTWKSIGKIIDDADKTFGPTGKSSPFIHVSTMTEVKLDDGTYRIFCPFAYRTYAGTSEGLYTKVYYSDDGGATWKCSENDTRSILPGAEENLTSSWSESKIIKGSDGVVRMYYSRNRLGCMQYTESYDGGVTWSGLYQIPEMQCPMSSFGIYEDPTEPGTFYMAWVNCKSQYLGYLLPRTRICLAKSTDGKNWEFLMNLEWTEDMKSPANGDHLYQILDPSVYITEDYVYICYGNSDREFSKYTASAHQFQMLHYTRVEKDKLQARAWDASTVHDMSYPKTIEYENAPQTKYGLGDFFVIGDDVQLKITNIAGEVTYESLKENCTVYTEPNMYELGKQTIQVAYENGYDLSYEIEIVPNYKLTWNISDGGTVVDAPKKMMEGATRTFELEPDRGYKVDYVLIDGKETDVKKNSFVIENIQSDLEIDVVFTEKTFLDYWPVLLIVVNIIVWGGLGTYIFIKKKKGKSQDKGKEL